MTANALSEEQSKTLGRILRDVIDKCDAEAVAVCDIGGYVLGEDTRDKNESIANAAALAAGSFAATNELAQLIGEPGFKSISHRGRKSGIVISSLCEGYLILVILGQKSVEGLVRLFLKKVTPQLASLIAETTGQSAEDAGHAAEFEVEERPEE